MTDLRHSLLHFHSTNCLCRCMFDRNANSDAVFACSQQTCLDEQELLDRPNAFPKYFGILSWDSDNTAGILDVFDLLKAIDLTGMIGQLLSHFFDNLFPLRCARILHCHLTPIYILGEGDEDGEDGRSNSDKDHNDLK